MAASGRLARETMKRFVSAFAVVLEQGTKGPAVMRPASGELRGSKVMKKAWTSGLAAFCLSALLTAMPAAAQSGPVGASVIPRYGKANPGRPSDEMRAGPGNEVRNVTYPTLTPVLPKPA